MVKSILPGAVLVCLFAGVRAQTQDATALRPLHVSGVIKIDGILDEELWGRASVLNDFVQCQPQIGGTPTESTTVRFLYDDEFIYIGVEALDATPEKIIATGLERDIYYGSDDNISLLIDTYHDQRQGILFSTNTLSARFDEEVLDNGNFFNAAFNTFWDVRSARNERGYATEFRIPFSSLRFHARDSVVMGIKVIRYIKHKNELAIFPASDASVANAAWRVNNAAPIVFDRLKSKKPFYVAPYVKGTYHDFKFWNSQTDRVAADRTFMPRNYFHHRATVDKVISNIGLDVKYGLSKNFTLDLTLNTDFAQAETDNRVLNFTRFAVNLPEKRNFFLESKDYLGFTTGSGVMLFNSRTIGIEKGHIVPIIGGVRLSGKANRLQVGLLNVQTAAVDPIAIDPQNFTVVRLRQEVWDNGSYVGGIATNRASKRGTSFRNQTFGVDALRRFRDNHWILGVNLGATNDHKQGITASTSMANVVVNRVSALGYNLTSSIEYAGRDFKPMAGFRFDSSYVTANISNGYIWKYKKSAKMNLYWVTQLIDYRYRIINDTHESVMTETELGTSYKNGMSFVVAPFAGREYLPYDWNFVEDVIVPANYYNYRGIRLRFDSKQTGRVNYAITTRYMGFYAGTRFNLVASGYYAINKNFRLTSSWEMNIFQFPVRYSQSGVSDFQSNLITCGVAFSQSIYLSAKALIQYDDISKTLGGNFRVRVNPREGTDLYIVYNPRLHTAFPNLDRPLVDQQTLIVKFTRTFRL
ncbi:DUF5916 domain-containing protein [Chryseolinea sp. T2]|uniref:carbohydrate binding family 9 domain-containing protein n=1 Tax=Chryseolinea sp. T2 TaxID=3129255 RepID=UPI0030769E53